MGESRALVKYAELFDPARDMPEWVKKYARWLIGSGAWGERLEGSGRRRRSKQQHMAAVHAWVGEAIPWPVLIEIRKMRTFRDYGNRWMKDPDMRITEKMQALTEKAADLMDQRLDVAGEKDQHGKFKVSNKDLMLVAGKALDAGLPKKSQSRESPLIQINITEAQAKSVQKVLEEPKEEVQDVSWEIVKDEPKD